MSEQFDEFVRVIETLRGPNGCPWDKEQTIQSLKPYLIEECYELADSIEKDIPSDIQEELGDVLLQVVMLSTLAKEKQWFDIEAVITTVKDKMVRRHPHVFGDIKVGSTDEVWKNWEKIKKSEKNNDSPFASIPNALPALIKANKLQKKAQRLGMTPDSLEITLDKITQATKKATEESFGELLFSIVGLCRKFDIDPEQALNHANTKFKENYEKNYLS